MLVSTVAIILRDDGGMFGVFLFVAALQGPWSATPPRPTLISPPPVRRSAAQPRPRLDIDLSGLSDDDAVAAPGFDRPRQRPPVPARDLVWSPRINAIAPQNGRMTEAAAPPRPASTLTIAEPEDPADGRIDPVIADLIGSVQLPMVSNPNAPRPRGQAPAAATRTLAVAPAPRRRYEPGRW